MCACIPYFCKPNYICYFGSLHGIIYSPFSIWKNLQFLKFCCIINIATWGKPPRLYSLLYFTSQNLLTKNIANLWPAMFLIYPRLHKHSFSKPLRLLPNLTFSLISMHAAWYRILISVNFASQFSWHIWGHI